MNRNTYLIFISLALTNESEAQALPRPPQPAPHNVNHDTYWQHRVLHPSSIRHSSPLLLKIDFSNVCLC